MTARELIDSSAGRFMSVCFVKRTTGEVRVMNCRLGVRKHLKGGPKAYDDKAKNVACVFDAVKGDYRCIPLEAINWIQVDGVKYELEVGTNNVRCTDQQVRPCSDPEDRAGEDRPADADVLAADSQREVPQGL